MVWVREGGIIHCNRTVEISLVFFITSTRLKVDDLNIGGQTDVFLGKMFFGKACLSFKVILNTEFAVLLQLR